jgi:hypothetical protein
MSDETTETSASADEAFAESAAALTSAAEAPVAELAGMITQLPAGVKLSTNLDTFEKERPKEPFWFQHGGAYFHLLDPEEVDFDDLVIVQEQPRLMMHILLEEAQQEAYFEVKKKTKMTVGKMKQLVKDYSQHFGLTDLGELAGSARR